MALGKDDFMKMIQDLDRDGDGQVTKVRSHARRAERALRCNTRGTA